MRLHGSVTASYRGTGVTGDPFAFVETLHGVGGETGIELLFGELIGD
jgi:hypothetical protein